MAAVPPMKSVFSQSDAPRGKGQVKQYKNRPQHCVKAVEDGITSLV